jgi:hypothetical protein
MSKLLWRSHCRKNLREVSNSSPAFPSASCSSNPVNVTNDTLRKIVIDDQTDTLEVDSSAHEICANEDPGDALTKVANNLIALALWPIRMYDIYIYTFIQQFLKSEKVRHSCARAWQEIEVQQEKCSTKL